MRILCLVKYDGSMYQGYQIQPNQKTVQEEIEKALAKICKTDIKITASGRLDAKVHALSLPIHFDSPLKMEASRYKKALNSLLPDDIEIIKSMEVEEDFHARFMALRKLYVYKINLGEKDLFLRNYVYQDSMDLDTKKMQEASKLFIGEHDFSSFCSNNEENVNFRKKVEDIRFIQEGNILNIEFQGDGFKRYMIRMMVGTLIEIAKGKIDVSYILERLDSKERKITHYKARGEGLYLKKVDYGRDDIYEE